MMQRSYIQVVIRTLVALTLQLVICVVPYLSTHLSGQAFAANGQCRWEGGAGVLGGFASCKAEDCLGDGGLAYCSAGVGAAAIPYDDSQVGPDKWTYGMCDEAGAYLGNIALWCRVAGGTWTANPSGPYCTNLPSGYFGPNTTNREEPAISNSDAWIAARFPSCSTALQSDTGWGANVQSSLCWSGPTQSKLKVPVWQVRQRVYSISGGSSCTTPSTFAITLLMNRDAKCAPGYKTRTSTIRGLECYLQAECCEARVGNPVSAISGTKFQEDVDYRASAVGGLQFSRYYKSTGYVRLTSLSVLPGPLEKMRPKDFWRNNYDSHLFLATGNSEVMAIQQRADGTLRSFDTSGREMANTDGAAARLQAASGGYDLVLANSDIEHYDVSGLLTSITTRSGLATTLTYLSGLLATVTDAFGHTLTLGYNGDGLITSVTLPDGSVIHYAYDGYQRLITATNTDTTTRQYLYADSRNKWLLTGIIDENGTQFATYSYDANGAVTSESHAGGVAQYQFAYGASSTTVTDPLGTSTQIGLSSVAGVIRKSSHSQRCLDCGDSSNITYDTLGNPASKTDFNGNQTTYSYDATRNLETSRTEAYGTPKARTISTQWHATYRLPIQIDEPGRRTTFTYDTAGNLLTRIVTDTATSNSRTWTYTYNNTGQVLTIDGPRTDVSDVTTFTYYSCATGAECGQVQSTTNALGQVTTYNTYNANGQPLVITDPNGVVTTLTYDSRNRVTSRTVSTETTTFDYWPTGLLKGATLPDGSYLAYSYDDAHRLTVVTDSEGNSIHYTLDAVGNRTHEDVYDPSNALAFMRSRVFDSLGRLSQDKGAANQTTTFGYDNNGNNTSITDPANRVTSNSYDELSRLSSVTDPMFGVIQYGYDTQDNLTSVTDPRSLTTSYVSSGFGEQKQLTSPDTGITQLMRDSAGNVTQSTDARGKNAVYTYDALSRVTQLAYSDQTIQYSYDQGTNGKGRLTQVTDGSGSTQWTYDALGRPLTKQQIVGSITLNTSYAYNSFGQLTSVTTPSAQVIGYTYANGRVSGITMNGATVLNQVLYAPFGGTRGWNWGNGNITAREYNTDGQLTTLNSAGASTYSFNPDGTIASRSDDAPVNPSLPFGTTTLAVNAGSNKVASSSGVLSRAYGYDAAGNTLSDGGQSFTYNDAGRLSSANNGTLTTTYLYNALGQRVRKSNSSGTTYFLFDEAGRLLGEYDATGALIQELVWLGDIPVASIRVDESGTSVGVFYIHTDHLNTPRKITSPKDNSIVWRWDSDPFGNGAPNEDPDGNGKVVSFNLRFPGQYYDQETGLSYNMQRYYDPQSGRYITSDPIGLDGGSPSTYAYANGNPVSNIDPEGLSWGQSAAMTWNWFSGTGPDSMGFGPGSSPVNEMMYAPGVMAAKRLYEQKNKDKDKCDDCKNAQPVTDFKASFGLSGLFKAGLNPTQQFVGSYRVDIYPAPDCHKWIIVTNTSSFKSFAYGILPDWNRSTFGPMGNMSQTYWWIE